MNRLVRAGLVVVAISLVGGVVAEAAILNRTKASLRATRHRVTDLEAELAEARDELRSASTRMAEMVGAVGAMAGRVNDLESEVGTSFGFGGLGSRVDDLESEVADLASCMNRNVSSLASGISYGSYFTWHRC